MLIYPSRCHSALTRRQLREAAFDAGAPHAKHVFDMTRARTFGSAMMSVGKRELERPKQACMRERGLPVRWRSACAGRLSERESAHANKRSYDVSADLVIMAGWLHPIPFRTRP